MKVFKFGGASVNSIERIKNVASILQNFATDDLVIIISAMGKTTNALEKVAESFYANDASKALELFSEIKNQHTQTAQQLLPNAFNDCYNQLQNFYTEIEWLLHDKPVRKYDYYYDQIVSIGELLSTCIVSYFLNEINVKNTWFDVRDILKTDDNFRDANVDFEQTTTNINTTLQQQPNQQNIFITQGYIGCTNDNETTTLGREGSDYTAAIFANILNAESLTIWKDVEGVMNADPKQFANAQLINQLSFEEVIEMAFYGAQVIHPKTIKPLQNKKIPLYVKCFLNANLPGTVIKNAVTTQLPPIIVIKQQQVLLHLQTQDFSFVGEKSISFLYQLFEQTKCKPNLIQTGAISVQICLDNNSEKLEEIAHQASNIFNVQLQKNLTLITIRNYNDDVIKDLLHNKNILLQQQTTHTLQAVVID